MNRKASPEVFGRMRRRPLLAALGGGMFLPFLSLGASPAGGAAIGPNGRIAFDVFRGGDRIGHHVLSFREDGNRMTVDIEIELSVSIAFVTVYSYSHRNSETWEEGRLVSLEAETDDNGDGHFVTARNNGGGLAVEGSAGSYNAPSTAIPSSYWNMAFIERNQIINTQDGRYMPVTVDARSPETVRVGQEDVPATRYDIGGTAPLTIWYSDVGQWVGLSFMARGSAVTYALDPANLARA